MNRRSAALGLLLLASAACRGTETEYIELGDLPVPSSQSESGWERTRTIVFRVVDVYGEPIAGAEAFATHEREHPRGGEFWHTGRAVSDRDGVVQLRVDGRCDLVNVRADGFADAAEGPYLDAVVLQRARPVPVRVVDWLGRTATGELGYTKYCGHRPDLEVAPIGADGIAWLQRLGDDDRELYARCPGLGDSYDDVYAGDSEPSHPPYLLRLFESPPVIGRLVGRDGQPLANVPVGGESMHRGPWTWTGADGSFRLDFLPPDDGVEFEVPAEKKRRWLPAPPRAQACELRAADGVAKDETARTGTLRLRLLRPDGTPVLDRGLLPGLMFGGNEPERDGDWHRAEVVAGDHALALGAPLEAWESDQLTATVTAGATTEITLPVRERPRVRVVVRGGAAVPIELATARGARDVEPGVPIAVPCDGRAAFWIGGRAFPLPADFATRTQPIELVPPMPTIVGRVLDESGAPCAAIVTRGELTVATAPDGTFSLPAGADGSDRPIVFRAAGAPNDGPVRVLPLRLPTPSDDRAYDIGDVRLWQRAPFALVFPDGETHPVHGALLRDGRDVGAFSLDEDGSYDGPEPRAGDHVVVGPWGRDPSDDEVGRALVLPLVGDGPWPLREPTASIAFDIVDADGTPVRAQVSYGRASGMLGADRLASLAPGTHRCVLTAEGHRSATVQVVLADGEQRTVRVVLPRLPAAAHRPPASVPTR